MTQRTYILVMALLLAGCQAVPPKEPDWADWMARIDDMDAAQLNVAQAEVLGHYETDPVDLGRLRAGYVLSRPNASQAQLEQARDIVSQISPDGDFAAYRELLSEVITLRTESQRAQQEKVRQQTEIERLQSKTGELEGRIEGLLTQVQALQTQLDTLKAIEEDMAENQQQADETQ